MKNYKFLKITDDSIASAREELENEKLNADLSYRSGVISDGQSRIEAKYNYDLAVLEAKYAETTYNDTIAELKSELKSANSDYEDALAEYTEYLDKVNNNKFYEEYKVEELKATYEEAAALYTKWLDYYELSDSDITVTTSNNSSDKTNSNNTPSNTTSSDGMPSGDMTKLSGAVGAEKTLKNALGLMKSEALETKEEYKQALDNYQKEVEGAQLKLEKLQNALELASENQTAADLNYQKKSLSAKTTYETALVKNQTAKKEYDTKLTSLQDTLDKLKDAKDEAGENLAIFEKLVGDGYLYTEEAGTILMVRAEKGGTLAGGDMIMAYSNPEKISVSVSVSQSDIAKLYVGESATVTISDYGNFDGIIESINPVAASDSRTSVTYSVIVNLEGEVDQLESNLTATVIFGDMQKNMKGGFDNERKGQ